MKPTWTCYLATPIDQVMEEVGGEQSVNPSSRMIADIRQMLKLELQKAGCAVYDPVSAWESEPLPNMTEVNEAALRNCEALLAYLPDGVPSIGVPVEIERASQMRKPIVVLGGDAVMNSPMWGNDAPTVGTMDIDVVDLAVVVQSLYLRVKFGQEKLDSEIVVTAGPTPRNVPTARPQLDLDWSSAIRAMRPLQVAIDRSGFLRAVNTEVERAAEKYPFSDEVQLAHWFSIWAEEVVEVFNEWTQLQNPIEYRGAATIEQLIAEIVQVGAMSQRFWMAAVEESGRL